LLSPGSDSFVAALVDDGLEVCDVVVDVAIEDDAPSVEVEAAKFHPLSWTAAIFVAESADNVVVIQLFESS
jgi:hypothetical protein